MNNRFFRIKGALVHFLISAAVIAVFLLLVRFIWYPNVLFFTDGGWQGSRIVLLVDVVLGPLLTLMVFSPTKPKKELVRDISVIGLIQLAALLWGIWTVYHQRPVALVISGGKAIPVTKQAYDDQNYDYRILHSLDQGKPPLIFSRKPVGAEIQEAVELEMNQGTLLHEVPKFYQSTQQQSETIRHDSYGYLSVIDSLQDYFKQFEEQRFPLIIEGRYGLGVYYLDSQMQLLDSKVVRVDQW